VSTPSLHREDDGGLRLDDLAPWFVSVLLEIPDLLEPDQPDEVLKRLYPEPSDDKGQIEEWEKFVHPDLFALIASAREIVMKDLASLVPADTESPLGTWEMRVPAEHVNAWISALNAARLALGAANSIEEEDMNDDDMSEESWDDKRMAVAKIHLLGWLQQMIIEDISPPPEGFDIPDSLPPDVE
jgi:hypothetical protein